MGRKAVVTQEDVFNCAERLLAEGREVTANLILADLGGGSLTTIYKHLNEWRESRPNAVLAGPIEIPGAVQAAFAIAWRVAATESAKEIAAAREKAGEEVKEAQNQFKDALESIEQLEKEGDARAAEIDTQKDRIAKLEEALHSATSERAALQATVEQQKQRIVQLEGELDKKDQSLKESYELKGELESLRRQNKDMLSRFTPPAQGAKGKK